MAEGGTRAAHCRQSTNFSNGPRNVKMRLREVGHEGGLD
jgi:hypothetical protein